MPFSVKGIRARLEGFSPLQWVVIVGAILGLVLLVQYMFGAFGGWKQAREYQRQVDEQKASAQDERKKREAAEKVAADQKQLADNALIEAAKQEAISNELRNEIKPALEELAARRVATASSGARYDQTRRAPRKLDPNDPPDSVSERLRNSANEFRKNND